MNQERKFRYRSLFWPILLIGVGMLWLLANLEIIPRDGWLVLLRFWPVLLIGIGLDIMIGRQSALIGGAIGVGVVALALVLVVAGPKLGLTPEADVTTDVLAEPLGSTETARIELDLSVGSTDIAALEDSTNLLEAEITHLGELDYSVGGEANKTIRLSEREHTFGFDWIDIFDDVDLRWEVYLAPGVPLDININGGVGEARLDFRQLDITKLDIDSGVGDMTVFLPATGSSYEIDVDVGVGRVELRLEEGIDAVLKIDGGVGDMVVVVPKGVGVRFEGDIGVGNLNVPSSFDRLRYDDDNFLGESGTWESANYDDAAHRVTIDFDGGVGDFSIREAN